MSDETKVRLCGAAMVTIWLVLAVYALCGCQVANPTGNTIAHLTVPGYSTAATLADGQVRVNRARAIQFNAAAANGEVQAQMGVDLASIGDAVQEKGWKGLIVPAIADGLKGWGWWAIWSTVDEEINDNDDPKEPEDNGTYEGSVLADGQGSSVNIDDLDSIGALKGLKITARDGGRVDINEAEEPTP